jgi:hypothetical protein
VKFGTGLREVLLGLGAIPGHCRRENEKGENEVKGDAAFRARKILRINKRRVK